MAPMAVALRAAHSEVVTVPRAVRHLRVVPDRTWPVAGAVRGPAVGRAAVRGRAGVQRPARRVRVRDVPLRAVAVLAAVAIAISLASLRPSAAAPVNGGLAVGAPAATEILAPGETLWDIAVRHTPPGTDARAYLQRLLAVNDVEPARVPAGATIVLPTP